MADNRRCEPKKFGGMSNRYLRSLARVEILMTAQDLVQERDTKNHIVSLAYDWGVCCHDLACSEQYIKFTKSPYWSSKVYGRLQLAMFAINRTLFFPHIPFPFFLIKIEAYVTLVFPKIKKGFRLCSGLEFTCFFVIMLVLNMLQSTFCFILAA